MHVVTNNWRLGISSAPFEAKFMYIGFLFQNYSDIEKGEAENGDGMMMIRKTMGKRTMVMMFWTVRSKGGQSPTGARILTSHLPGHAHQQHHRLCHHHHHLLHHHRLHHHHTWTNADIFNTGICHSVTHKDDSDVSHMSLTQLWWL